MLWKFNSLTGSESPSQARQFFCQCIVYLISYIQRVPIRLRTREAVFIELAANSPADWALHLTSSGWTVHRKIQLSSNREYDRSAEMPSSFLVLGSVQRIGNYLSVHALHGSQFFRMILQNISFFRDMFIFWQKSFSRNWQTNLLTV